MTRQELRNKALTYLKAKRVAHVLACEETAVKLASLYGEDEEKAATAALLHDITKKLSYEEQLEIIDRNGIPCDDEERNQPKILHAKTGAFIARRDFGIDDEIYGAIRYHTTGKPDMTLLEKIIYLADCIEPTRDYPMVDEFRQLAFSDIDAAMAYVLKMSIQVIKERGNVPYRDTTEAYEYYNTADT